MEYRIIARRLRTILIAFYVCVLSTAAVFELSVIPKGLVTEPKTIYILQVVAVVLALALIPISFKSLKGIMERHEDDPDAKRMSLYITLSVLRQVLYFIVMEFSIVLYYLINDTIGLYCLAIGFICSLFCYPTEKSVENDME